MPTHFRSGTSQDTTPQARSPLRQIMDEQREAEKRVRELKILAEKMETQNAKDHSQADRCKKSLALIREDAEFITRQLMQYR